ncbi:unnamed protein product [Darwinula stevensoni]|uniref:Uncharacterized protein n=1 Tax=Darwinula stevensoni TaxID=69355 RepID=A0A7R9AA79_9CRUS|nr:unnamed protein product [Darwinula stevensoni]CAG0897925.1 unnamed protein product [Darwinula stevensoni]
MDLEEWGVFYRSAETEVRTPIQLLAVTACGQRSAEEAEKKVPPVGIKRYVNQVNNDGSYTYGFESEDGTFKLETRDSLGNVKGKYGFIDENQELKVVEYAAGNGTGFEAKGNFIPENPNPSPPPAGPRPPRRDEIQKESSRPRPQKVPKSFILVKRFGFLDLCVFLPTPTPRPASSRNKGLKRPASPPSPPSPQQNSFDYDYDDYDGTGESPFVGGFQPRPSPVGGFRGNPALGGFPLPPPRPDRNFARQNFQSRPSRPEFLPSRSARPNLDELRAVPIREPDGPGFLGGFVLPQQLFRANNLRSPVIQGRPGQRDGSRELQQTPIFDPSRGVLLQQLLSQNGNLDPQSFQPQGIPIPFQPRPGSVPLQFRRQFENPRSVPLRQSVPIQTFGGQQTRPSRPGENGNSRREQQAFAPSRPRPSDDEESSDYELDGFSEDKDRDGFVDPLPTDSRRRRPEGNRVPSVSPQFQFTQDFGSQQSGPEFNDY